MRKPNLAAATGVAILAAAVAACSKTSVPTIGQSSPVISTLHTMKSRGSTIDALNGDRRPAGLVIAGASQAGSLLACNSENSSGTPGTGTTIEVLPSPAPSSTPFELTQSASLAGCTSLTEAPDGVILAAAPGAGELAVAQGSTATAVPATVFPGTLPAGVAYATTTTASSGKSDVFYASNASDGSIYRLVSMGAMFVSGTQIATGFAGTTTPSGVVLGPTGLAYDPSIDTLYVADGQSNDVTAIANVSSAAAGGIVRSGSSFSGSNAASASIVASGSPLNGPSGAAVLFNGDVVVSNTLDGSGSNLLVEISPREGIIATLDVDSGAGGALGGLAAFGTARDSTILYFVDANSNTVQALSR